MKTKIKGDGNIDFAKCMQLILDNPSTSLSKSSISLLESMILSIKINTVPDREEEMRELLQSFVNEYENGDDSCGTMLASRQLLNELKQTT